MYSNVVMYCIRRKEKTNELIQKKEKVIIIWSTWTIYLNRLCF